MSAPSGVRSGYAGYRRSDLRLYEVLLLLLGVLARQVCRSGHDNNDDRRGAIHGGLQLPQPGEVSSREHREEERASYGVDRGVEQYGEQNTLVRTVVHPRKQDRPGEGEQHKRYGAEESIINFGRCQKAQIAPRTRLAASANRPACNLGRA